jgi:hypothetical protein
MRASKTIGILAGSTAIALATLFAAAPASAATLPTGQRITIIDEPAGQYYNVSPADAASTPVGTATGIDDVTAIDVNDEGLGFALGFDPVADWPVVYPANANTGTLGTPVPVHVGPTPAFNCAGIDLQPNGTVIAACGIDPNDGSVTQVIGVLNPVTGELTTDVAIEDDDFSYTALAYDAVTGVLWAFTESDGPGESYIVDLAAGTATFAANLDNYVLGADFDRSGQLFVSTVVIQGDFSSTLGTANPTTGAVTQISVYSFIVSAEGPRVSALTVWGALAATGSTTGAEALPVALGSALLLLAGAAFVATSRIQRRAA